MGKNRPLPAAFNLADEYINQKERFGYWCDTGVRLQGPAAWSFATIFLELWASQRPDDPGLDAYREEQPFPAEEPTIGLVQPYSDSPVDDENVSEKCLPGPDHPGAGNAVDYHAVPNLG